MPVTPPWVDGCKSVGRVGGDGVEYLGQPQDVRLDRGHVQLLVLSHEQYGGHIVSRRWWERHAKLLWAD